MDLLLEQSCLHFKYIFAEESDEIKLKKLAGESIDKIMPDVDNCLGESKKIFEALKKNYKLGIVSNFTVTSREYAKIIGFTDYVSVMVDSETAGIEKPHPGIFSLALQI